METGKQKQASKARLGAIGENLVMVKLMQHNWDAFNTNHSINNYESIDIICLKNDSSPESGNGNCKPPVALIQVKTSTQSNIPIGMTIADCLDKDTLSRKIIGPYVFVSAKIINDIPQNFRYFILSRSQAIELFYEGHKHYVYDYVREKEIDKKAPAGVNVSWLEGKPTEQTDKHKAFINPLAGNSSEDCWANIWKD